MLQRLAQRRQVPVAGLTGGLVAGLVAAVFAVTVLPRTARWAAPTPATADVAAQPVQQLLLLAARGCAVVLVAGVVLGVLHLVARLRAGSRFHRRWAAWSGALLVVLGALLALTWPGYWAWDEYAVLAQVRTHVFDSWQTVLTPLWLSAVTHVVPSGAAVVVVQVLIAAGVGGWVLTWVGELTCRRWPVLAVAALLVSPPVLLNDLYPLRLTVYAYLALAVVCRLVVQHQRPEAVTRPALELAVMTSAVGVLVAWRSEGVLWLLVLPVLVHRLAWRPWQAARRGAGALLAPMTALLVGGAVIAGLLTVVHATENRRYRLTAAINPLSLMLQHALREEHLQADLAAMDAALDLDAVRAQPDPDDVTSFRAAARPDAAEHLDAFQAAYTRTVLSNSGAFLRVRWETFARTTALEPVVAQVRRGEAYREPPSGAGRGPRPADG